jgi:hypothetical protein
MLGFIESNLLEGTMKARRLVGLFIAIIFVLTTVIAFAAGDSYSGSRK